jgi:hypothetical protein
MIDKGKELHERFFQMEKNYNLFELRTRDNFPIWDVVRYHAWLKLSSKNDTDISKGNLNDTSRLKKGLTQLRILVSFSKLLFIKRDNFYFGVSRIKNEREELYDPY